jgi:hypothetical protein
VRTTELAGVVHTTTEACRDVVLDGSAKDQRWLLGEVRVAQLVYEELEIRLLSGLDAEAAGERRVNGTERPKSPAVQPDPDANEPDPRPDDPSPSPPPKDRGGS